MPETNRSQKLIEEADVHAALRAWSTIGGTPKNLLATMQLVQHQRTILTQNGALANPRLATNEILMQGIDQMAAQNSDEAKVLRLRFPKQQKIVAVASQLNISPNTVSRLQRRGIDKLAEELEEMEWAWRLQQIQRLETVLPPPTYQTLYGVKGIQNELLPLLKKQGSPWVIALVGIGGIGKTALADSAARQLIADFVFTRVAWLRIDPQAGGHSKESSQQTYEWIIDELADKLCDDVQGMAYEQKLIQVRQRLKNHPHLIVIDNVESAGETAYLIAHLNSLADPSKILLTTRGRPADQVSVYHIPVDELPFDDAAELMSSFAAETGVKSFATATREEIKRIYALAGGNPLALKMITAMLDLLPLDSVLSRVKKGAQGSASNLYRYIYRETWQLLSSEARALLLVMPLVAESGGDPGYLQQLSSLSENHFWQALQELRNRSLLEVRGTMQEKQYGIHRLTATFINTDIIGWSDDGEWLDG